MSNETKPLLSKAELRTAITDREVLTGDLGMNIALSVQRIYEADRSKLIAVLRVCADGIDMMKQGSFADTFVFADDAELKAYADGILSQLKVIGVVPNK